MVFVALVRKLKFFQICQEMKHAKPFKQKSKCDATVYVGLVFLSALSFSFALSKDDAAVYVAALPEILRICRKQDLEIYGFCW